MFPKNTTIEKAVFGSSRWKTPYCHWIFSYIHIIHYYVLYVYILYYVLYVYVIHYYIVYAYYYITLYT